MTDLITTDLEPVPSRTAPSTFSSRMDTWLGKISTWTTEANALATGVNANAVSAVANALLALGAGNYKGVWADLTGPAEIGWGVSKGGFFYRLSEDLVDITSKEPGVDPEWILLSIPVVPSVSRIVRTSDTIIGASNKGGLIDVTSGTFTQTVDESVTLETGWWLYYRNSGTGVITYDPFGSETIDGLSTLSINSGDTRLIICDGTSQYSLLVESGTSIAGGAESATSSDNVTLTAASKRVQSISISSAFKSVILPDATTLEEGGALFVIKNTGSVPYEITDPVGGGIAVVLAGQIGTVYLTDNSTAAGSWVVGDKSVSGALADVAFDGDILAFSTTGNSSYSITWLTPTQTLLIFTATSTVFKACTLNVDSDGINLTAGAIATIAANGYEGSVTRLTDTQAIVTYNTSPSRWAMTLNVSGTTVTAGTPLALGTIGDNAQGVCTLSSTQAVAIWGLSGHLYTCTLNVSGTTVTKGNVLEIAAVTCYDALVDFISPTKVLAVYTLSSTYDLFGLTLDISDTTISANAIIDSTLDTVNDLGATALSPTKTLLAYKGTSNYLTSLIITTVADDPSFGTPVVLNAVSSYDVEVNRLSATQGIVTFRGTSQYATSAVIDISTGSVRVGDFTALNAATSTYVTNTALSPDEAICVYTNSDSKAVKLKVVSQ